MQCNLIVKETKLTKRFGVDSECNLKKQNSFKNILISMFYVKVVVNKLY